jgi:hypothetical protein
MISTTFDILKFIETLKAADVFATKVDVQQIKMELSDMKSRMRVTEWMLGFIFAGVAALILKTFF